MATHLSAEENAHCHSDRKKSGSDLTRMQRNFVVATSKFGCSPQKPDPEESNAGRHSSSSSKVVFHQRSPSKPHRKRHFPADVYCDCAISWKAAVKIHKVIKYGQIPRCKSCGRYFQNAVPKHVLKSFLMKPLAKEYKCNKCDLAFLRKVALKSHKRLQHERIRSCNSCGWSFSNPVFVYQRILDRHFMRRHRKCKICLGHYLEECFKRKQQ